MLQNLNVSSPLNGTTTSSLFLHANANNINDSSAIALP